MIFLAPLVPFNTNEWETLGLRLESNFGYLNMSMQVNGGKS